jgi:predicted transcriptional regulator
MSCPDPVTPEPAAEDAAFIAAVEQAQASLAAGHSVPYEQVRRWLLSWGTDHELPPPECP